MAVVAIAAAVGAIAAYYGARSKNKAKAKQRKAIKKREAAALQALSPEAVAAATRKYQPLFREEIAGGEGPLLKQATASSLARHGLTGTGVGEAIRGLSATAPDAEAFRRALEKGYATQLSIADTINRRPIPDYLRENPYTAAIQGAAQGYFGAKAGGFGGAAGGGGSENIVANGTTYKPSVAGEPWWGFEPVTQQANYYDVFRKTGVA